MQNAMINTLKVILCFEFHTLNNVVGGWRGGVVNTSISKFLILGIHHYFNMQLSMNVTKPHLFYQFVRASKMVGTPIKGTCHISLNDTWVV